MRIYEIDNNVYMKMINYYCQIDIKKGEVVNIKNPKRIYFTDIDSKNLKSYTIEEYTDKKSFKDFSEESSRGYTRRNSSMN